jgi:predicted metal-binding transcription factor (methanogenesis marker protein 9)
MDDALHSCGFAAEEIDSIYAILAGILHLGNGASTRCVSLGWCCRQLPPRWGLLWGFRFSTWGWLTQEAVARSGIRNQWVG